MSVYYKDQQVTLLLGDAAAELAILEDGSVDCVVTSPPYFGLRDYGQEGQIGNESHPLQYLENLESVFEQVRRVLAFDGTLWLNLGDSYQDKCLLGLPAALAALLRSQGWILRNDIIWSKPNAMPESVKDRFANRHEHLYLFSKSRKYHFDLDSILEPLKTTRATGHMFGGANKANSLQTGSSKTRTGSTYDKLPDGRNPGDVWEIATQPFAGAHFATMPPNLVKRCLMAGCKPNGVVLDPFSGSATVGMVANQLGHKYIGIDLNPEYHQLALETRLSQSALHEQVTT